MRLPVFKRFAFVTRPTITFTPPNIFLFQWRYQGGIAYPNTNGVTLVGANAIIDDMILISNTTTNLNWIDTGVRLSAPDQLQLWAIQNYQAPPLDGEIIVQIDTHSKDPELEEAA